MASELDNAIDRFIEAAQGKCADLVDAGPTFKDEFREWLNRAATFSSWERRWAAALMDYFTWDGVATADDALECYREEYPA